MAVKLATPEAAVSVLELPLASANDENKALAHEQGLFYIENSYGC